MLLNKGIPPLVLIHWFISTFIFIHEFVVTNMVSITLPMSGLDGLTRRHLVIIAKFSLCPSMVMNAEIGMVYGG